MKRTGRILLLTLAGVATAGILLARWLPELGAGGLLHPARHRLDRPGPDGCESTTFAGDGVTLAGWRCQASTTRRGTLVYLHGIADNRASAIGVIERFRPRGFDVVAYDSRAHGESSGDICTYGYYEKADLRRVLDTIEPRGIVLLGTSLGAAAALQTGADDRRVAAIVAAETFSDLSTVARERAPFFFTDGVIRKAFTLAEARGRFQIDAVSPVAVASRITVPVLLIHGAEDRDTPPTHSQRVFDALGGPKRLMLVPGAHHNGSLTGPVWQEIERWIDGVIPHEPLQQTHRSSGDQEIRRFWFLENKDLLVS